MKGKLGSKVVDHAIKAEKKKLKKKAKKQFLKVFLQILWTFFCIIRRSPCGNTLESYQGMAQ